MEYKQPQMTVEAIATDTFVMLKNSLEGPEPAPMRHETALPVPGGSL